MYWGSDFCKQCNGTILYECTYYIICENNGKYSIITESNHRNGPSWANNYPLTYDISKAQAETFSNNIEEGLKYLDNKPR